MTFGYRSRSGRGGFRSPRGGSSRGSFRGCGRGSDSYFGSSSRGGRGSPYGERSSYRGSPFKGSGFRERDDYYESRGRGNKYHDRYSSSHRKDEDLYHHRDIRESTSGSFGREHSRRIDAEPERKKIKSEIANYRDGASPPRRSYDDLEHSSRGYNSSSSPYHSEPNPFKPHRKEYPAEFKKPLPVEHEFSGRRVSRGTRARGTVSRTITKTNRPAVTSSLKRMGTGRVNKLSSATRLQLLLRRKKQLRIMRMRRTREERLQDEAKHEDENEINLSEGEDEEVTEEGIDLGPEIEERNPISEPKKMVIKEPKVETEEPTPAESSKPKKKERLSPVKGLRKNHIALKCIHCKAEYETFKVYHKHLQMYKHKKAMENLLFQLKQKLSRMRTEQREQQRIIDEQSEDFAKTSYCKLCKLNYKQTKQEHYTSDFHVNMSEFLNPRCSVCRMKFQTPILYEHHRSTLSHIKRKAFIENKKSAKIEEQDVDEDENNDEDSFMVLDSVGSADESNDESEDANGVVVDKDLSLEAKKKSTPKIVGNEFIKKVTCYYCKLCRMCLSYHPNKNQDEVLLSHCRSRYHLKRYSLDKMKSEKKDENEKEVKNETSLNETDVTEAEHDDKFWADGEGDDEENHKLSEDEEDSKSSSRYDRFRHSNVEQKTNIEDATDTSKSKDVKSEVGKE